MKPTLTVAAALEAARASTRCAELDIRRAHSAVTLCGQDGAAVAALEEVLLGLILPVTKAADTLTHLVGREVHRAIPDSAQDDMAQYRQRLGRAQRDTPPSRIPDLLPPIEADSHRDIAGWARAMIAAGLAYNITDDPGDITTDEGRTMFNATECNELRNIVATFTEEEAEEYLGVLVARVHEQASEPLEQPEPPPAPTLPGSRCQFRRDGDGCQCNVWQYPAGDRRHVAEHVHRFSCRGKVPGTNPAEPCDGDEGHSGPCFQIPF